MKKIIELSVEEFRNVVNGSKTLCEKLQSRIEESEMDFIGDKIRCVCDGLRDWSVGSCNANYLHVGDAHEFLAGVQESIGIYGGSDKLTKAVAHCEKLEGTNLFDYSVRQLADLYLEEELQPICDYIFDCFCETSDGNIGEKVGDYLECFHDDVADYLWDEESHCYYEPYAVATA